MVVRRLRDAGAMILGKTNLPELAIFGFTESPTWGDTRNPWDLSRTPGGSSGGSAAAVAAGLCAIAHATDGAGSIRYPAANCGLFGLKPQRNRVSLAPDREHWHGLSVYGCDQQDGDRHGALPRRGERARRRATSTTPPPFERPLVEAARTPPGKLRIACTTKTILPVAKATEVIDAYEETIELLRSLGHQVTDATPNWGRSSRTLPPLPRRHPHEDIVAPSPGAPLGTRPRGSSGSAGCSAIGGCAKVRERMPAASRRIQELWRDYDVLLTPMTASSPWRSAAGGAQGALRTINGMSNVYPYAAAWNYTGQPAAAVPAGFTDTGLPRSVMLIARPNDEATLISLGGAARGGAPLGGPPALRSD